MPSDKNRTLTISKAEASLYHKGLITLTNPQKVEGVLGKTIHQSVEEALPYLPEKFVDLLFIDPPYNKDLLFNSEKFTKMKNREYEYWFEKTFVGLYETLKPTASVYVCCDILSSEIVHKVLSRHLIVRNRITWERDKGRGSQVNWKNNSEDIWFATASDDYYFNADKVMLKKKVVTPYKDKHGRAKDWREEGKGKYRLTYPSNIWTDITVPFWSMPENTDHPTQKPEKLLAKIILASTKEGNVVLDPFLGSGTTSVVAKKLRRNFVGIEKDLKYCLFAEKRLALAEENKKIQGYEKGVFWERSSARA